jgi:uncharacterized surface protein with fasciclin (FAS1) repeats
MIKGKLFFSTVLLLFVLFSCKRDDFDKYARPEWLTGKVYSQIKSEANLSTFAKCLELTGYDKIIDVSGSYTVFAPTNEAFQLYLKEHPGYDSVGNIPAATLLELVKYHIVQNPWSVDQLRSLDVNGWIDPEDEYNDKPRGFKRQTLLLEKDTKYGVKVMGDDKNKLMIIDTTETSWYRRVANDLRKYAPIFYFEYFGIYNLQLSDYSFYFNRQFENPSDMFFVNGKLVGAEIFAENGFIHPIDRVVEPLKNANEILRSTTDQNDYSKFLNLVNKFPSLVYNEDKTFAQPGADQGLVVDSLFDLTYPELAFNINSEKTKAPAGGAGMPNEVTIRFHHGLLAPTNAAFDEFVNQYINGANQWGSMDNVPVKIQKIIANSYFSINPFYDTDIQKGFYNGELDIVRLDYASIVQKEFGSNCTFIGLNKPVVPRAFKSVTGPVYRQQGYTTVMNAIEYSGLLSALKREGNQYALFVVPDVQLRNDSTLLYYYFKVNNDYWEYFNAFQRAKEGNKTYRISPNDIRLLLLNQVSVELPRGIARKEFLETLAGNHLIWDNTNGTVRGTASSTDGYGGSGQIISVLPSKISNDTDNGNTYAVNGWFSFNTITLYSLISTEFKDFHNLMVKAGLALEKQYKYNFISDNQLYTVFVPTKEALDASNANSLEGEELVKFLKSHFIVGDLIFTDGKLAPGYYETAYEVSATNTVPAHNLKIYIDPGIDQISIPDKNGNNYFTLIESDKTNKISSRDLNTSGTVTNYKNTISTAVVHSIDKALMLDQLDTQ